jgi:crotonobetainyl-CoA:carnitine CoA-transferase CaiB-like acyl-CoA transferase
MTASPIAAFAILMALRERRRTGQGQWIDLAQYEVGVHLVAPAVMDFFANGVVEGRIGNRHPAMAPHGVYPCAGAPPGANWIAIAVRDDREFTALCAQMGRPELAADPRFAFNEARYRNQDELDAVLAEWTSGRDRFELFHELQAAGVAAAPVQTNKDVLLDPHLNARELFVRPEPFPRAEGVGRRPIPGLSYRLSQTPGKVRWMGPPVSEHNEWVLGDLLGYSAGEIARCYQDGTIGKSPPPERLSTLPQLGLPLDKYVEQGVLSGYDPDYRERLAIRDETAE